MAPGSDETTVEGLAPTPTGSTTAARRNGGNGGPPRPPTRESGPSGSGPAAPRRRPKLRKLRLALVLLGLALLGLVSWVFGIMMAVASDLPELENRRQYQEAENSIVYDINGERIARLTNNQGRILVESNEIAPTVKEAVVAIEDERFYEHRGVDFEGIARALYQDVLSRSAKQGGSTITQQFVKNALAAQDSRTIMQKLREAALAYHLERQWPKDKVLTEYLNSIYFGEGAYGIEAAARTYFGSLPEHEGCGAGEDAPTCASQLFPWEAALLAGIISSPSAYSPRANPEAALERRNLVLQRMAEQGYITAEEYAEYSRKPLPDPDEIAVRSEESAAPYFTSWLRQQLVDHYGAGEAFGGGLHVLSTLDLGLQRAVEEIVASRLGGIEPTAAVVVLDNETAGVRAMVGGPDFEQAPFNLATNGHRQPGSAFKPFTLVTALSEGISPSAVYASAPQRIPFEAKVRKPNGKTKTVTEVFAPSNYEDSYLGSASVTSATTYSDNSVYAQLGVQVGVADVAETAAKLGIETDLRTDVRYAAPGQKFAPYNPALILGGLESGVTPLEMAHAYETLAMGGRRISGTLAGSAGGPVAIEKVLDEPPGEGGETVETATGDDGENKVEARQVIDPAVAKQATQILATVVESGTGTNAATEEPTWGKTGTTDDNGDAWFCGATDEITACVWVGHPDTVTPMTTEYGGAPVDGGTYPALIFRDLVLAYEELQKRRGQDDEDEGEEEGEWGADDEAGETTDPGYVPPAGGEVAPEPAQKSAPPDEASGGESSAPAPSAGGGRGGESQPTSPSPPPTSPPGSGGGGGGGSPGAAPAPPGGGVTAG